MPLTAAAGPVTAAEHHAMLTLANCTEFQSWVGAANEAAAKGRIYFDWPTPPASDAYTQTELNTLRPYAVIQTPERGRGFATRRQATGTYVGSGQVLVDLLQNVPEAINTDPSEVFRRFKNTLGLIISNPAPNAGLQQLAYEAPDDDHLYLTINAIDLYGPRRADEEEIEGMGDFLYAQLVLHWGP